MSSVNDQMEALQIQDPPDDPYAMHVDEGPPPEPPVPDIDVPSLVNSLPLRVIARCLPFIRRDFIQMYYTDFTTPNYNQDVCLLIHRKETTLVYLSPCHEIMVQNLRVTRLNFQINSDTNHFKSPGKGKRKWSAHQLLSNSILCYAECDNGVAYPIWAGIEGELIEINDKILKDVDVISSGSRNGWIAIIQPDTNLFEKCLGSLVNAIYYAPHVSEPQDELPSSEPQPGCSFYMD